jgi:hypothetical protein
VVGLICFVALYIGGFWAVHRARGRRAERLIPGQNFWRTWILMSLAYCVTYSPDYDQSLLLGMLISLTSRAVQPMFDEFLVSPEQGPHCGPAITPFAHGDSGKLFAN